MTALVEFSVYGRAAPAGALQIGGKGDRRFLFHRDSGKLSEWKGAIKAAAGELLNGKEPYRGAVSVDVVFYVARPQGHFGAKGLKPSALAFPIKRSAGDVDKLARALLDALTGVVFADDSQVVTAVLRKRFADGRPIGIEVCVKSLDDLDATLQRSGYTP